ncbi:hypothetical protein Y032_0276g1075 [Ancylostoma ceylanicum]|uniref:Uncharacterized protein n=1 Tax=Ancylostoma ceylanicum TaxID=53326 RepID=A0A016S7K1_9BILA|nr:hypothetical protein Y032_0276g1075 [Ancylostoma ceylanicum]
MSCLLLEKFLERKFGANWPLPVAWSSRGFSPAYFLDFNFLRNPGYGWEEHFLLLEMRMDCEIHFEDFVDLLEKIERRLKEYNAGGRVFACAKISVGLLFETL